LEDADTSGEVRVRGKERELFAAREEQKRNEERRWERDKEKEKEDEAERARERERDKEKIRMLEEEILRLKNEVCPYSINLALILMIRSCPVGPILVLLFLLLLLHHHHHLPHPLLVLQVAVFLLLLPLQLRGPLSNRLVLSLMKPPSTQFCLPAARASLL
jgi:hypothetical protein